LATTNNNKKIKKEREREREREREKVSLKELKRGWRFGAGGGVPTSTYFSTKSFVSQL